MSNETMQPVEVGAPLWRHYPYDHRNPARTERYTMRCSSTSRSRSSSRIRLRKPPGVPTDYVVVSVTVPNAPCWTRYAIAPSGARYLAQAKTMDICPPRRSAQ